MDLDDLEMFFLLYFYLAFTFSAGNMQRVMILACIARNRALRGQLLAINRERQVHTDRTDRTGRPN